MKKSLKVLVFILLLAGAEYYFRADISAKVLPTIQDVASNLVSIFNPAAPCAKPIPYVLGTFDPKFNISQKDFLSALTKAEAVWENAAGKDLFTYSPDTTSRRPLSINLVYDYRQEATTKLNAINTGLKTTQANYDALRTKYNSLRSSYRTQLSAFNAAVAAFNKRNQAYEAKVNYWNQKGGAPDKEYKALVAEQKYLAQEAANLKVKQAAVNSLVDQINTTATELNKLAGQLNLNVDQYNTVSQGRGESFEEGLYKEDNGNREIDIYEFASQAKLVRVLAHELGHALGLEHVAGSASIMYEINEGTSLTPSIEDLEALNTLCGSK
jgi:hypothetical protein